MSIRFIDTRNNLDFRVAMSVIEYEIHLFTNIRFPLIGKKIIDE